MTEEKIERINELYRKAKAEGLTEEEKKEQQVLRKQFIDDFGITNLWVAPDNEIAKHIYEKSGFTVDDNPIFIAMRLKGGAD